MHFNILLYSLLIFLSLSCNKNSGEVGGIIPSDADSVALVRDKIKTPMERALYHFKMGETYSNAEDSYKAMEELLEAEKWCVELKNDLLKGQIYWYKGKLYHARLDYTNAINMYILAAEHYTNGGNKEELMYTYEQMGQVYSAIKNYEEAILCYNKAKALAMQLKDIQLRAVWQGGEKITPDSLHVNSRFNKLILNFSTAISGVYFKQLNSSTQALEELEQAYIKYNSGNVSEEDYLLLSCIYLDANKISIARDYVDKYIGWKKELSGTERAALLSLQSSIEKGAGDYKKALEYRERYDATMESIAFVERNSSIREVEQQYWQQQLQLENEGMKVQRRYILVIYLLLLVIISVVGYIFVSAYKRRMLLKNAQIEEYMTMVDNLDSKVSSAESSANNLLNQLDVQIEREKKLKELLEGRFSEVRELVRTYYEFGNSKKLQKKVDDLLKLQLSGDNFEVIEEVVNAKNNNAIKKVRESFPTLKEDNIKLLNLIYAGFSAQEISVILNDTPQNIYVRKSRLKKTIASLIAVNEEMNFS